MENNFKNKIINGDSLEELKKIPSETFDLVFADPPYNLQLKNLVLLNIIEEPFLLFLVFYKFHVTQHNIWLSQKI